MSRKQEGDHLDLRLEGMDTDALSFGQPYEATPNERYANT